MIENGAGVFDPILRALKTRGIPPRGNRHQYQH
jgi:hypothetical protein